MLDAEAIRHDEILTFSAAPMASAASEILYAASGAVPWASIAAVTVAWIRSKASRKVIVTLTDGTVVHAEGLSVKELESVLDKAETMAVFDTKAEK
ncbi:hypothetical protein [Luteibacter aegosomatissinici]|uniref:hypothetical protein n=1 Tax=Luteibacter aegosomatissinici TaxID=2911539 RepID=UPI001FF7F714|nr:hypothetical protein [Luteibacter aegosomatissinici]UPG94355.1 hypothetical protein L2Y97_21480 [Luteibacter aegosomatissinici]